MKHLPFLFMIFSFVTQSYAVAIKPLNIPNCKKAKAIENYKSIEFFTIPDSLKTEIALYKKDWIKLCEQKHDVSIHNLLSLAESIQKKMNSIVMTTSLKLVNTKDIKSSSNMFKTLNHYFAKVLPSFIPAFQGEFEEYEHFELIISDFDEISTYGTKEDSIFFKTYSHLKGSFKLPIWYKMTWDYGGCIKFGQFNWVQSLKNLEKAKTLITSPNYKRRLLELETSLERALVYDKELGKICVCQNKKSVKPDIENIISYLKEMHELKSSKFITKLKQTLLSIQTGHIKVASEQEKHCSGG